MNSTAPTAGTLYNYDTDRDAFAGRFIQKGGAGPNESDPTKYQQWRSPTYAQDTAITGAPQFIFWSAMKDFTTDKRGHVQSFLKATNGSSTAWAIQGELQLAPWASSATWVEHAFTFTNPGSGIIPAGHWLELVVVVSTPADDDMWFAYDTSAYPSRLVWP
jgi:hypothetical protein